MRKLFLASSMIFPLCALLLIAFMIVFEVDRKNQADKFDKSFTNGQINIPASSFGLGETGHPKQIETDLDVPLVGQYKPSSFPRTLLISGCEAFLIGKYSVLHIATEESQGVVVQMPSLPGGGVSICSEGLSFVTLWFE